MNGDKGNLPEFINRLKVELQQDKKKTTMLVILLVVGGIVGGRLVVSHGPPDDASAAGSGGDTKSTLTSAARLSSPKSGNQNVYGNVPSGLSQSSGRQIQQIDFASMDRTIDRDLFWPNTQYFPSVEQVDTPPTTTQPDQAQQLAAAKQREHRRRIEHVKSIHEQAKALCLTSTMLGRSPTALINGQVLRAGEMIKGFRLKSIAPDYCVVTRENVDVKLQMKE